MSGNKNKKKSIVHYDREADVLAIYLKKGLEESYAEIAPGISVELDKNGGVIGIEAMGVSRFEGPP